MGVQREKQGNVQKDGITVREWMRVLSKAWRQKVAEFSNSTQTAVLEQLFQTCSEGKQIMILDFKESCSVQNTILNTDAFYSNT